MNPSDVITRTAVPIGKLGAAFYFRPDTLAVGKQHGLGGMKFYVLGRGGALGDCDAAVVHSGFGYFNPELIRRLWEEGSTVMAPTEAARLYLECAAQTGRDLFGAIPPDALDGFNAAAARVIAEPEGAGLALFAGLRSYSVPADAPAAAMHHAMVLRELRGSFHLLSLVAVGLNTATAHAIKRPDDVETFGWTTPIEPTDDDRRRWQQAEEMTNQLLIPAYGILDDDEADALVQGVALMAPTVGQQVV